MPISSLHDLLRGADVIAMLAALSWPRSRTRPIDADAELVAQLRAGDETAFLTLVAEHNAMLLRVAGSFVRSRAVAEEVVQDTWLGVLRGIHGFAGRASFKTWLLRILVNRARSAGTAERRSVPVGAVEPAVEPSRFDAHGRWSAPPQHWIEDAEDRLLAQSLAARLRAALEELPGQQRRVLMLRDVEGLSGEEVCAALQISHANQRVLLHRGRSRLRQALESELTGT